MQEQDLIQAPGRLGLQQHRCVLDDDPSADLLGALPECLDFLARARGAGGRVLVHCNLGQSRSASVTIAYIMQDLSPGLPSGLWIVHTCKGETEEPAQPSFGKRGGGLIEVSNFGQCCG